MILINAYPLQITPWRFAICHLKDSAAQAPYIGWIAICTLVCCDYLRFIRKLHIKQHVEIIASNK
jgi:hypothetical protein